MNSMSGIGPMHGAAGRASRGSAAGMGGTMTGLSSTGVGKGSRGGGMGDIVPKGFRGGQISQLLPEQQELLSRLFSLVSPESDLFRLAGGDESAFEEMEAPAHRLFQEQLGQLGSRFSQLAPGAMSAQKGSGFQNAATQATSDFAMNLASRRKELQREAIMDLLGISNDLLAQRPFEKFLAPKKQKAPGFWDQFGSSFARSAGQSLGGGLFGGGSSGGGGGFPDTASGDAAQLAQLLKFAA